MKLRELKQAENLSVEANAMRKNHPWIFTTICISVKIWMSFNLFPLQCKIWHMKTGNWFLKRKCVRIRKETDRLIAERSKFLAS